MVTREHRGWWVLIKSDNPEFTDAGYYEEGLMTIPLKQYGKFLRNLSAMHCPWCQEHGRDPNMEIFHKDDYQCWHHCNDEHMPACPHRK